MYGLGVIELLFLLVLIVLLFGVGRISKIGKEMGSAINVFKRGITGGGDDGPAVKPGSKK